MRHDKKNIFITKIYVEKKYITNIFKIVQLGKRMDFRDVAAN